MDQLPEELLCRIIKEVGSRGSVRHLPLVKKKFARIARPLLYDKIKVDFRYPITQRKARKLLETFIKSLDQRSLCHHLHVGELQTIHERAKNPDNILISLGDLSNTVQQIPALRSFPLEWQRKFGADLSEWVPDAMLAAILILLPNLHRLILQMNRRYSKVNKRYRPYKKTFDEVEFTDLHFNETLVTNIIELATTASLRPFSLFSRLTRVLITDYGEEKPPGWDTNLISFF